MELTGTQDSVSLESVQQVQCSDRLLGHVEQNVFCLSPTETCGEQNTKKETAAACLIDWQLHAGNLSPPLLCRCCLTFPDLDSWSNRLHNCQSYFYSQRLQFLSCNGKNPTSCTSAGLKLWREHLQLPSIGYVASGAVSMGKRSKE